MSVQCKLMLMFEWGGGALWCDDDIALDKYGFGPIEQKLPLSAATQKKLEEAAVWHDTSLNWDYPPYPSPWSQDEFTRFDEAAAEMLQTVQSELGDDFSVRYEPLGERVQQNPGP